MSIKSLLTKLLVLTLCLVLQASLSLAETAPKKSRPLVLINTNMGGIVVELWPDKAPLTVKNFLKYVDARAYDNTIFHRVIDGFMIQGGGFRPDMSKIKTFPPIKNEARSGLRNSRGTIAMARTSAVDSATSQFFINLKDNHFLNHRDESSRGFGYAVFGKVIKGMDVVDKIAKVKTTSKGFYRNVPVDPVIIKTIRVIHQKAANKK